MIRHYSYRLSSFCCIPPMSICAIYRKFCASMCCGWCKHFQRVLTWWQSDAKQRKATKSFWKWHWIYQNVQQRCIFKTCYKIDSVHILPFFFIATNYQVNHTKIMSIACVFVCVFYVFSRYGSQAKKFHFKFTPYDCNLKIIFLLSPFYDSISLWNKKKERFLFAFTENNFPMASSDPDKVKMFLCLFFSSSFFHDYTSVQFMQSQLSFYFGYCVYMLLDFVE